MVKSSLADLKKTMDDFINYLVSLMGNNNKYNPNIYESLPYQVRQPYEGEDEYFKQNPNVGGMKTEDRRIILNPYSTLNQDQLNTVKNNEAIRLYLDDMQLTPYFNITEQQKKYFENTPYNNNPQIKNTIAARILTNDPSAGKYTDEQSNFADYIYNLIKQGK